VAQYAGYAVSGIIWSTQHAPVISGASIALAFIGAPVCLAPCVVLAISFPRGGRPGLGSTF